MRNIKIMVNFPEKKVVHTSAYIGSSEYEKLVKMGYEKVGVIKVPTADIQLFWANEYFDPLAKYIKPKSLK